MISLALLAAVAPPPSIASPGEELPAGIWYFVQEHVEETGGLRLWCVAEPGSGGFTDYLLAEYEAGTGDVFAEPRGIERGSDDGRWAEVLEQRVTWTERGQSEPSRTEWFLWLSGFSRRAEVVYIAWAVWGAPGECTLRINGVEQPTERLPVTRGAYVDIEGFQGGVAAQDGSLEASVARHYVRETDGLVLGKLISGDGAATVVQTDPEGIQQTSLTRHVQRLCSFSCRIGHVNRGPFVVEIVAGVEAEEDLQTSLWLIDVPYPRLS